MRWLRLLAGDGQTRLRNRYNKINHLSLLDTPRTYCSQTMVLNVVNTEAPPIDQNVSGLGKHVFAVDGSMMGTRWEHVGTF